jgi:hypothetical protein
MHWSKSRHVDYTTCARRFFYSSIAAPRNPHIAALARQQAPPLLRHEIVRSLVLHLAEIDSIDPGDVPPLLAIAESQLASLMPDAAHEVKAQMSIVAGCVDNFLGNYHRTIRAAKIVYVSPGEPVDFVYAGISMMALPELVLEKDGYTQIMMFKTTPFYWADPGDSELRAGGLVCWARSILRVVEAPVIVTEVFLRDSSTVRNMQLSDDDMERFLVSVQTVTDAYSVSAKISDFPASPDSQKCRFCRFRGICPEWLDSSDADFEVAALKARITIKTSSEATHSPERRRIFLAHASEDKERYVLPFARLLEADGISYWLDEGQILWGDSLSRAINQGLREADYLICFITDAFLGRGWPEAETAALLHSELSKGGKRVLPLLISSPESFSEQYPLLRDKKYLRWESGPEEIMKELQRILRKPRS